MLYVIVDEKSEKLVTKRHRRVGLTYIHPNFGRATASTPHWKNTLVYDLEDIILDYGFPLGSVFTHQAAVDIIKNKDKKPWHHSLLNRHNHWVDRPALLLLPYEVAVGRFFNGQTP